MSAYQTLIILCLVAATTTIVVISSFIYQMWVAVLYAKSALYDIRDVLREIHKDNRVRTIQRIQIDPTQRG